MNVLNTKFATEMVGTIANMYRLGWNERNGGNLTTLLTPSEVEEVLSPKQVLREIPLNFDAKPLAQKFFMVTGSGKYFKNVENAPTEVLGVVQVSECGKKLNLLWGLENGAVPTSELPSHFMSHIVRLQQDENHRIIMHCHPTNLIAMTFSHSLQEEEITKTLWEMSTECLVVFPEGVSVVPWIVPGTNEIGKATSAKMAAARLVIWPHHGIYAAGCSLDEAFGLIETAEKAATIYTAVCAQGGKKQTITDSELNDLGKAFGVVPRKGILKI
ncbi:MAG: rhamnulose-1-phosphate aldolase [Defluviitaleaceae bacterium]|nr:rhamnulose-1-phosphate aldolase [Defluviitaleaceae bacterium]